MKRLGESHEGIGRKNKFATLFLWSAPVAFRRVALEIPEWTSRDSNHHRQSVSAARPTPYQLSHRVASVHVYYSVGDFQVAVSRPEPWTGLCCNEQHWCSRFALCSTIWGALVQQSLLSWLHCVVLFSEWRLFFTRRGSEML